MTKINRTWNQKYELIQKDMGEGGNATVHIVKDSTDKMLALKQLKSGYCSDEEKTTRFTDEINIMTKNSDLSCIMPIIDTSIDELWYVMPVAEPLSYSFSKESIESDFVKIQNWIIELAKGLFSIHSRGISHRDIKPDNIYLLNGKICYGDFGLVDFPDNSNSFTKSDRGLGAVFTIAPEMLRNPKEADGKKADVYSLAKTIWILLTGESKGFDGQYIINGDNSLRHFEHLKKQHLVELEGLLYKSTAFNPEERPQISQFVDELKKWLLISSDIHESQHSEWNFISRCLFGEMIPESATWVKRTDILSVLNLIGSLPVLNHMLYSSIGGGFDFIDASIPQEEGCIELHIQIGGNDILKPKRLHFECFVDSSWNYFLLELEKLEAAVEGNRGHDYEMVIEDRPGHYVSNEYAQYGVYDYDTGEELPEDSRCVCRLLNETLLFVMKNGYYNCIPGTYDGRHGMCEPAQFRTYIDKLVAVTEMFKSKGHSEEEIKMFLSDESLSSNPFAKNSEQELIEDDETNPISSSDYVCENIMKWSFDSITKEYDVADPKKCKVMYCIKYYDIQIAPLRLDRSGCGLCVDGKFRTDLESQLLYVDSIKKADEILHKCKTKMMDECSKCGISVDGFFPSPQICLCRGKVNPSHMFTKVEIEELMRKADDRQNNTLVVDEEGYAKLITEDESVFAYPVRIETWMAGNNYVGRYSDLSDLESAYERLLYGWKIYLETGKDNYIDYIEPNKEDDLLQEIKVFYDTI